MPKTLKTKKTAKKPAIKKAKKAVEPKIGAKKRGRPRKAKVVEQSEEVLMFDSRSGNTDALFVDEPKEQSTAILPQQPAPLTPEIDSVLRELDELEKSQKQQEEVKNAQPGEDLVLKGQAKPSLWKKILSFFR